MATRMTTGDLKCPVGAPAHDGHLVAELHHGGPDVIEELNFGHGLEAARGHADGAADDVRFRQRRIEHALVRRTCAASRRWL